MIKLHQLCTIGNKILKHAIGIKVCLLYGSSGNKKIPGTISKYFNWDKTADVYPFFKTHKLEPQTLLLVQCLKSQLEFCNQQAL